MTDPVEAITAAWERFRSRAEAVAPVMSDAERASVVPLLREQACSLEGLWTKAE